MTLTLGVDLGTSSVKALLFDTDRAEILATAGQEYPIHTPTPNQSEQDPEDWWRASIQVIQRVLTGYDSADVKAVGLTGQMHGGVLLGQDHKPIHNAIIWADQRSGALIPQLLKAVPDFPKIAGTLPAAGFFAATLVWLKQHTPQLLERTRYILLPKDYLRLRMTGEIATDVSDAAATALLDISTGQWSQHIINTLGLPDAIYPSVLASSAVSGRLSVEAAEQLGLQAGMPVIAGCADQPAQAIANGLITPGKAAVTIGTGGQVCVPLRIDVTSIDVTSGQPIPTDARLHVFNHAVPDMWYILGATLSAGLSLRWLRNTVGLQDHPAAYAILSAEAAQVPAGADGLLFLPYLVGERTPLMDAKARGGFIGLRYHHTRGHLARAVMEGVTFSLRQTLELSLGLAEKADTTIDTIIIGGAGGTSTLWSQLQADIYGLPMQQTLMREQTSLGAALLAAIGTGIYADFDTATAKVVRYGSVITPNSDLQGRYNDLYQQFASLYPRLRDDFHQLSLTSVE